MCSSDLRDSPTSPSSATAAESTGSVNAGPFVFRASPVAVEAIRWITPLGNLNPPDHTVPTDHIYFYIAAPDGGESFVTMRTAFFAPADGTVTTLFGAIGAESKIVVRATSTISYYIDHIIPDVTVSPGTRLTAGQRLGTSGAAYAVDLGVINTGLTLTGFANPMRYPSDTLHADAPLKYYEEPLRSQLYAKVQRLGSDLDGKIDLDVPGRLAGNWYVENGTNAVAFAYNTYDPTQVRISIGGILATNGVYSIGAAEPRPLDVIGLILFSSGTAILSWLLEVFGEHTLDTVTIVLMLGLSVALLAAYAWHASEHKHPLLRLTLLKVRTFRIAVLGGFITRLGIGGLPFLLPLLYQLGLKLDRKSTRLNSSHT